MMKMETKNQTEPEDIQVLLNLTHDLLIKFNLKEVQVEKPTNSHLVV